MIVEGVDVATIGGDLLTASCKWMELLPGAACAHNDSRGNVRRGTRCTRLGKFRPNVLNDILHLRSQTRRRVRREDGHVEDDLACANWERVGFRVRRLEIGNVEVHQAGNITRVALPSGFRKARIIT